VLCDVFDGDQNAAAGEGWGFVWLVVSEWIIATTSKFCAIVGASFFSVLRECFFILLGKNPKPEKNIRFFPLKN
jgi:hypothetical protein